MVLPIIKFTFLYFDVILPLSSVVCWIQDREETTGNLNVVGAVILVQSIALGPRF